MARLGQLDFVRLCQCVSHGFFSFLNGCVWPRPKAAGGMELSRA